MKKHSCAQTREAAMARADGEIPELTVEEIATHLLVCAECRREIQAMQFFLSLSAIQERRGQTVRLWPQISRRPAQGGRGN